jgi:hypothetical protein
MGGLSVRGFSGFIFAPFQSVAFDEEFEFLGESAFMMMCFLFHDVFCGIGNAGVRDGKHTITAAPAEFSWKELVLVYPVGAGAFEKLHYVFHAALRRKIYESVDVLGVHEVDLHVDAFLGRVLAEISG